MGYAICHVILALVAGPLLMGVINRTKAFFGGRQGPSFFQPYYDLIKLLRKGAVYSRTTSWVFRAGPTIGLAAVLTALLLTPLGGIGALLAFPGDLLFWAYTLGLMRFCMVLAAMDTGSAFEGMGASREAFFCVQDIHIGMTADLGSLQRLPKLMPLGIVKELAYTGRRMGAQEAANYGLVNAVYETPEATVTAALACAREIAAKPPVAIWGSKQVINYARDHSVSDSLQQMGWVQSGIWSNQHVMEAVSAMQAKRAGDFPPLEPLRAWSASDDFS